MALGFGASQAGRGADGRAALDRDFDAVRDDSKQGWDAYDGTLNPPPKSLPGITKARAAELRTRTTVNANVLKASEDKTFPGAIVASMASPWGQAVSAGDPNNTYFGSYREVFARDLYEILTGLMAVGDRATARDCHAVPVRAPAAGGRLDAAQQPRQRQDRAGLLRHPARRDRVPDPDGRRAGPHGRLLYSDHIKPAANFVASHGPTFGSERWEEQGGFSPSTIAAEIAGLVAAADLADANGDPVSAAVWRGVADDFQRSIKGWTVTTNGPLAPRVLHPPLQDRRPQRRNLVQRRQRRADPRSARR